MHVTNAYMMHALMHKNLFNLSHLATIDLNQEF